MTDAPDRAQNEESPGFFSRGAAQLSSCGDPHWGAFMLILLLPAAYNLLCFFFGPANARDVRASQLSFFWGLAVYAGVLKWIGWNVLTRFLPDDARRPRLVYFPAEIFCGLAFCCAWFYLRNLLALVWPASYGLVELSLLKYAVAGVQIIALLKSCQTKRSFSPLVYLKQNSAELAMVTLFAWCLFMAFRDVSFALHVQSSDPLGHAFAARSYMRDGIANGGTPIVYTTGFGAMNAVAATLAPLSIVQTIAIQHVFLIFTAFFAITGAICVVLQRRLWALHALIVPYLLLLPIHNLRPWENYEGTPRQAAPALAAALCVLPVVFPASGTASFLLANIAVVTLDWLCIALNPACAPFVAVLAPLALIVLCVKARGAGRPVLRSLAIHGACLIAVSAVFLSCDPYYRGLIVRSSAERPSVVGQNLATRPAVFSISESLKQISSTPPLSFEISIEETFSRHPRLNWLPAMAALLLAATALIFIFVKTGAEMKRLLFGALAAGGVWLVFVYLTAFLKGGLAPNDGSWDLMVLRTYLGLMLFRMQVVVLFVILAACGALLYVTLDRFSWRVKFGALAAVAVIAILALPWRSIFDFRASGFTIRNSGYLGTVTMDDLKLAEWADENLADKPGLLALGGTAYRIGFEKHLYPYSGSQAVILYGKLTNYCFLICDPKQRYGFDEYAARVLNGFDADWCLAHGIRWFFIKGDILAYCTALDNAIKEGKLRPIKTIGVSVIYEVVGAAKSGNTNKINHRSGSIFWPSSSLRLRSCIFFRYSFEVAPRRRPKSLRHLDGLFYSHCLIQLRLRSSSSSARTRWSMTASSCIKRTLRRY